MHAYVQLILSKSFPKSPHQGVSADRKSVRITQNTCLSAGADHHERVQGIFLRLTVQPPLGMYPRTGGRSHRGKFTPLQGVVCRCAEHLEGVGGLESAQVVAAVGQPHAQRGRAGSTGGRLWLERRSVRSPPRRQRRRSVRQPPLLRLFFCSAQPQRYTS